MSQQVQLRHDTAANWSTVTPAQGECVVDTTDNRILVGDGATPGGWPAARLIEAGAALGPSGSAMRLVVAEQLISSLSGADVTAPNAIPSGAMVLACSVRVVTAITGASSFSIGYTGAANAFGASLGIAAGATNEGMIGPNPFYSATDLILTASGGAFSGGAVRVALMYLAFTPPTS